MVFSSIEFIFRFLLIFLVVYYITPRRFRNIILLTGSLVFYAWGEKKYFFLILVSIFINYLFTLLMVSSKKRKPYLILMLIFNMGMLFVFKYLNFFIDNINLIPGVNISNVDFGHLPLGISFYTFQIISYVVDVYRNKFPAEKNIISFATYISLGKTPSSFQAQIMLFNALVSLVVLSSLCKMLSILPHNPVYLKKT